MIKENQKTFNTLFRLCDAFIIIISMAIAYAVRFTLFKSYNYFEDHLTLIYYLPLAAVLILLNLMLYQKFNLYSAKRKERRIIEIKNIVKSNILSVLFLLAFIYIAKLNFYSRLLIFIYLAINTALSIAFRLSVRLFLNYFRRNGYNVKYVLLIGSGALAKTMIEKVKVNPQYGYKIFGCLSEKHKKGKLVDGVPVLGNFKSLQYILEKRKPDEVIIAIDCKEYVHLDYFVQCCEEQGIKFSMIPAFFLYSSTKPDLDECDGVPLLSYRKNPLTIYINKTFKRFIDIVGSIAALTVFSPVMLLTAIVLKITTDEPVIFKQERIGENAEPFIMYKFRSMVSVGDCDQWTEKSDTRRTAFGSFIRRFSIDELPQFVNVLKGDMSIVGPRPEIEKFVIQFKEKIPRYMVKHQVKPGVTGLAQVSGFRGDTSIEERIDKDIFYIENWSLWLDIKIILKTIFGAFYNKEE